LEQHRAFIRSHRERAADLSPTYGDLQAVTDAAEAMILIELAQYCDELNGQQHFDPTPFFTQGLLQNQCLRDESMAEVVQFLLQRGMACSPDVIQTMQDRHPAHRRTYRTLKNYMAGDEVKDPGTD
jgi:hypothetical protein